MNLEIHGFPAPQAERISNEILKEMTRLGKEEGRGTAEWVVSIIPSSVADTRSRPAPFFRVYSDDGKDFKTAVNIIQAVKRNSPRLLEDMELAVECVGVDRFYEL